MNGIKIAERLWLEDDPRGATLVCLSPLGPEGTLFRVGICHQSLYEFSRAIAGASCRWSIKDGSLSAMGDCEEVTIRFCSLEGPLLETSVSLVGGQLDAFKWLIQAYALRNTSPLLN